MEVELQELLADLQSLNHSLPDPSLSDALHKVIPPPLFFSILILLKMLQLLVVSSYNNWSLTYTCYAVMVHFSEWINPRLHKN